MATLTKYYILPPDALYSHCWDGQCAIYHAGSGDTHLLSSSDMAVLEGIGDQPISCDNLSLKLGHLFDGLPDQYLETLLTRFEALGLVEMAENESSN